MFNNQFTKNHIHFVSFQNSFKLPANALALWYLGSKHLIVNLYLFVPAKVLSPVTIFVFLQLPGIWIINTGVNRTINFVTRFSFFEYQIVIIDWGFSKIHTM